MKVVSIDLMGTFLKISGVIFVGIEVGVTSIQVVGTIIYDAVNYIEALEIVPLFSFKNNKNYIYFFQCYTYFKNLDFPNSLFPYMQRYILILF